MYFYWRVQQDLNCLGEMIVFHDPCFINALEQWVRKNIAGIWQAEGFTPAELIQPSMN